MHREAVICAQAVPRRRVLRRRDRTTCLISTLDRRDTRIGLPDLEFSDARPGFFPSVALVSGRLLGPVASWRDSKSRAESFRAIKSCELDILRIMRIVVDDR